MSPIFNKKRPQYKPEKQILIKWDDFGGGWNNIFRPTELKDTELAQADNLMLTGKGVPTGRWGSTLHFLAGTGTVRHIDDYKNPNTDTVVLYALTDLGLLVKKSGASYSEITGASFASGSEYTSAQLGGYSYILSGSKPLVRFNGTSLDVFATISYPASVTATNLSGVSGTYQYSYRITSLTNTGGESLGTTAVSLSNLPFNLSETMIRLNWVKPSAASGVLRGFSIYRGTPGDERYLTSVDNSTERYDDTGNLTSDQIQPPLSDTTGGASAKYVLKFDDRLILAGVANDPTLVMISGRYPYQDRFHWADGGGYMRIEPDSGDEIMGLGIAGSQTQGGTVPASIIVYMRNSCHQLVLKTASLGNYVILDPQSQRLAPVGTTSHKTIVAIENNTFSFGRLGISTIGNEESYLNQIRTKEISARVRPYVRGLSATDFDNACAAFIDYKYLLSFPSRKETLCYDYERRCFMGPWKTPWGVTVWKRHYDVNNDEKWLAGADNANVYKFDASLTTDNGTAISKILRTRKTDFGDWSVMKVISLLYVLFRKVTGTVNISILLEERSGTTKTAKSFSLTGSFGVGGWGIDQWGLQQYGLTSGSVEVTGEELVRWTQLYKTARVMQIEVTTTGTTSNFEFLGVRANAQPMGQGSLDSSTRA